MKVINVILGPDQHLDIETAYDVATSDNVKISFSKKSREAVKESRDLVESFVKDKKVVYGLTTGFGNFKNVHIPEKESKLLQENILRSHSVGVGPAIPKEVVRAALFVRLNSLAQGYSGVTQSLLDLTAKMIEKDVIPVVPSQGSVGSSGDLAPLCHIGVVLMGESEVFYGGKRMATSKAFKLTGLKPHTFSYKEGLAWSNGTSVMLGYMVHALIRAQRLLLITDAACALSLEAIQGVSTAFRAEIHELRHHPGQITTASNIRKFIAGSKLVDSVPNRVQDSYSIRCAPQVHGASRDSIEHVATVVTRELNAVTDNPLIFANSKEALSGGNFHGEPLAQTADFLAIAVSELANISERRTAKLVDAATSEGLPMFLVAKEHAGTNSGLMISQYTAAALVSENKVLSHPASVDSIPTSANQEDHVSMGSISARKVHQVLENGENVLAIELLTAAQAVDFRETKRLGKGTRKIYEMIRKEVPFLKIDRYLHKDIVTLHKLTTSREFYQLLITLLRNNN